MSGRLLVLYQVSNDKSDRGCYNAFEMPRKGAGVTLAEVKRHCIALRALSVGGADGFHWRVRMDDKAANSRDPSYSWWDIQDENARLPIKDNVSISSMEDMFMPNTSRSSSSYDHNHGTTTATMNGTSSASKKASGAIRSLGKAMNAVAGTVEAASRRDERDDPNQPHVSIIAFKLLDLAKMGDSFSSKHGPNTNTTSRKPTPKQPQPTPSQRQPQQQQQPPQRQPPQQQQQPTRRPNPQPPQRPPQSRPAAAEPSLMDFVTSAPVPPTNNITTKPHLNHSYSSPSSFAANNESRAEKLKREYAQKKQTQNRVWDDIDQRWVEVDPNAQSTTRRSNNTSEPPPPPKSKKIVGIKIDAANAIGKSANVQSAVQTRVRDMQNAQQKAVHELKQREAQAKTDSDAEDEVRKRLEPKLRTWSEEHGKKKQLRALLSSLHMILWKESGWKQVSLGDILDEKKARRCYLKATLKVHPDKTRELDVEKRFIAKRVFDALSQAMTEFENSAS